MTTRQRNELERIRHRFGRTLVHPIGDLVALEVVGDGDVRERPAFRLVLGADGWVLRREAIEDPLDTPGRRHGAEYALDTAVVDVLVSRPGWLSSRDIAAILDENGSVRVAASLRRLFARQITESRGLSRDKQWRIRNHA